MSFPFLRKLFKTTRFWQDNYLILREFKFFRKIAFFAFIFTVLSAVFEGFGVGFLFSFLHSLTEPNAEPLHTGIAWFDLWILGVNASVTERLYRISILILFTTLLRTSFTYLGKVYSGISGSNLAYQLRLRIFEQLQSLSQRYFNRTRSGELINSITSEILQIVEAFEVLTFVFIRGSTLTVYIITMFLLSWQLTLISLTLFSLLSVGISVLIKQVREISFEKSIARGNYTSVALEFINGIRTVQAFVAQDFERRRFYSTSLRLLRAENKSLIFRVLVEPLTEGIATIILISMLLFSFAILMPNGAINIASLLTFLFVLFRLMPLIRQLNGARAKIGNFQGSIDNIQKLLRRDDKPYLKDGKLLFPGLKQGIALKAVSFGYESNNLVLHNITLTFRQGEMTALVGASGAGKTTLADLIPRFYDPTHGQITIDGIDLRNFKIDSLRRKIAIVSQDTFIFNTSVRENVAYGLREMDEVKINEAVKLANAWDFVRELPQGFETQLGDRGVRLSGGQRQRIAIARALLRDPEILILDEATSALDSVSERLIQESMEKLAVGRTVIAIAHRLSTIVRADKVIVLDRGQILEQGKYQELLERRGKLWEYHQMQHELSH